MKSQALSIVLLLILTTSSGCISDSNDNELAGTSWIIIPDFGTDVMEIYNEYGMEIVTIRTFNANGIVEDAMLPTDEGCPAFTIMDPNDDSLCIMDAAALDIGTGLEANQKWSIKGNGELILSGEMRMGENYFVELESGDGEDFCDMMRGVSNDLEGGVYAKYSMSIKLIWLDMENECVMSTEMRMSWELKDGNLLYHTVHPSRESMSLEASCVYGIEWTGQTELSQSELDRIQTLSSNCPDPIPDEVWARSETRMVDSSISQSSCHSHEYGVVWDEELSMCSMEIFCDSEEDSRFIYEVCDDDGWESYTRYQWQGDYLYIGLDFEIGR
jgi:hypothetical protein